MTKFKIMPKSLLEYEQVKNIILFYRDQVQMHFNRLYCPRLPMNLRALKDWNQFYKLFKFLEEREDYPYQVYIQGILTEFKIQPKRGSTSKLPYPTPNSLIGFERLFIEHIKRSKDVYGKFYSVIKKDDVVRKELGRDLIQCLRVQQTILLDENRLSSEVEILLDHQELFGIYLILTCREFIQLLENDSDLVRDAFPRKYEALIENYRAYRANRKDYQALVRERLHLEEVISGKIVKAGEHFGNNPHPVINAIQLDLEEINYKV